MITLEQAKPLREYYFGLMDKAAAGSVGKMTDIVAALETATKVVSV